MTLRGGSWFDCGADQECLERGDPHCETDQNWGELTSDAARCLQFICPRSLSPCQTTHVASCAVISRTLPGVVGRASGCRFRTRLSAYTGGGPGLAPWNVADALAAAVAGKTVYGQVRASLTAADPLTLALGRPNREQVTTVRQSTATTIQALELTNGDTLAKLLKRGAEQLVATNADGRTLAERVFQQALTRPPTRKELNLAVGLIGPKPQTEGVEDLLWSVAMLPEFQLTY